MTAGGSLTSSTVLGISAGLAGAAFVGYCIYFDHKRRSDPDFKKKLREKRNMTKQAKQTSRGGGAMRIPNVNNPTEMQAFFLQEVQMGEELMAEGDMEGGVEHLANAVALCGQPQALLQVLQQTIPPQSFSLLMQRLPEVGNRLAKSMGMAAGGGGAQVTELKDEADLDLE